MATLLAYRTNFINSVMASVAWGIFSLYSMVILTTRITSAYGWSREELLLFNGIYGIIMGFFHMFLSINMGRFSRVIHFGDLDLILAKPLDSQFAVSLWLVDYTMILRVLMGIGFTLWVMSLLSLALTLPHVLFFLVFAVCAWVLLYSLWFLVLTNIIWFTNLSNLVRLMYSFESMGRYPKEMARQLSGFLFFVVLPIALVINTPTRALINRLDAADAALMGALAIALWVAARRYWLFALKSYTSASS